MPERNDLMRCVLSLVIAAVLATAMWFYVDHVLIYHQEIQAKRTHEPRGNLSDLYPRWLGARELLLRDRDPYTPEVTREIQKGYWGRELDAKNPSDPKDEARFAYPAYVVFLLAPTVGLSFPATQWIFTLVFAVLTAASIPLWLRGLGLRPELSTVAVVLVLTLGSWPVVQALHLQQLTLLVAALMAGAVAALASGHVLAAGALLALATIKPQLAAPLVGWLGVWVLGDWKLRRKLAWSFIGSMMLLVIGAECLLPGWFGEWYASLGSYLQYNQAEPLLQTLVGRVPGMAARLLLGLAVAWCCWMRRADPPASAGFSTVTALVLTASLLLRPDWHSYDEITLLPAICWLALSQRGLMLRMRRAARLADGIAAISVLWSWITALALTIVSRMSPAIADRFHALPLLSVVLLPASLLIAMGMRAFALFSNSARNHQGLQTGSTDVAPQYSASA
jgi:hypothetical protein